MSAARVPFATVAERLLWVVDFSIGAHVRAFHDSTAELRVAVDVGRNRKSGHSVRHSVADALALADQLRLQALAAETAGLAEVGFALDLEPQAGIVIESRVSTVWLAELAQAIRDVVAEAQAETDQPDAFEVAS